MPVWHAVSSAVASAEEQVPGLLEVLAQVTDPRRRRGRRFTLVLVLAVAVTCVLAGAKSFREAGGQAGDLPQDLLAAPGGQPHPLRRRITAPGEKRIRTLLQDLDAAALDVITGCWLRARAAAGRLDGLLTAIAIDGKWLRGVAGGQVKLFAAMLHGDGVMIAQHRIPEDTNEITQVSELLDPLDLTARSSPRTPRTPGTTPRNTSPGTQAPATCCRSTAASPDCSAPSATRSPLIAAPPRTTSASITGTAASCAAPAGSPAPAASSSRTPPS